jgi:hypothetical protein
VGELTQQKDPQAQSPSIDSPTPAHACALCRYYQAERFGGLCSACFTWRYERPWLFRIFTARRPPWAV